MNLTIPIKVCTLQPIHCANSFVGMPAAALMCSTLAIAHFKGLPCFSPLSNGLNDCYDLQQFIGFSVEGIKAAKYPGTFLKRYFMLNL